MLSAALRPSLGRHSAFSNRRLYSSPSESTQKKAQNTLMSAQIDASRLWESSKKYLDPLTEKAGRRIAYKQPLLYNLSVTKEVLKQIYVAEGLQPQMLSAVRQAYESIWDQVSRSGALGKLVRDGEVSAWVGIYGLQAYGIFKIGEIVGRRSLIGYDLQ
ncbi:hypothetical protein K443DRAFT_664665 [Laccaria amethystina LaAM-08-1]|uniref:ATP synthase subunit g, mitochondrial n=1 Tax=Laccaria amethystina LaAM-08-1 TaxID=1095629 RepID=A0A0C9WGQ6_9AGAR|nr:hypothetical protein K443DRAFT_664665 [Laccaria amethystina LaAM-08-1]